MHTRPTSTRPSFARRLAGLAAALLVVCGLGAALPALAFEPSVALVQYDGDAHFGDYEHNMASLTRHAEEAVSRGARIIAFPEGSTHGYTGQSTTYCAPGRTSCQGKRCLDVRLVAEDAATGRTARHWLRFAEEHEVYVIFSLIQEEDGEFYNAAAVVGPEGFVGVYQKRALYGPDYCYARQGWKELEFATPYGRFGMLICADANFDRFFSRYKSSGVDGVIVPMDWDQSPTGERSAARFFAGKAVTNGIDIYGIDQPAWDGTGFYPAAGGGRVRRGLPAVGVGGEGVTYHALRQGRR